MRLGVVNEEAENKNKATKVLEQLEAAQAVKSEMEAELRRLRVQSDQWRNAVEAAATVLTPGNNGRIVERTGSLKSDYNSLLPRKLQSSPFFDDLNEDSPKRKNSNMIRKILMDLNLEQKESTEIFVDNQVVIFNSHNPVFHKKN
ncbi:interactor of constitutive active ROPs 2, chloroplastic-like [Phalaenopsis equestris]|uniref:interactor of constitutive active ROPs 2, chloroplastic-like n=1 Tax=Phalaenopsis equestris TaxID=78828 RepID=UPI0009E43C15|nr:interactor of constitutive active ROPs 2, chloroplastic-like [Phalaenopsis equestris]